MKLRHVHACEGLKLAEQAVQAARFAGVHDDDILLVAGAETEKRAIADDRKLADTDLVAATGRGAGIGAATGLLAGLAAVAIPPLGVTLAGAAAIGLVGAMVGSLSSALLGATVPDPVRQQFDEEIQAGRVLVVLDAEQPVLDAAGDALAALGLRRLPYEAPTALN